MVIKKLKESEITLKVTLLLPVDSLYVNNVTGIVLKRVRITVLYALRTLMVTFDDKELPLFYLD